MTILEVDSREHDGRVHVALRGELDLSTVNKVQEELRRVEAGDPPLVVLDLSALTFLDSTGLRSLIAADARGREQGRRLTLAQGPAVVRRVFEITGLEGRLDIVDEEPSPASEAS